MPVVEPPHHVLIAGCGYLGRRAALAWIARGVRVTALTRSTDKAKALEACGIEPLVADLASGALPALPAADTVLWAVGLDRSAQIDRRTVWIDGLHTLLRLLPQSVRRILYVSSTSVYGQSDGETVSEKTAPAPTTEGGRCCLEAEQIVRDSATARDSRRQAVILRMAGIYGPDRLLRRIDDLRRRKPVSGEPENPLNLIHVDDAVTAILTAAAQSDFPALLNVVNAGTLTRRSWYTELARLTNSPPPEFAAGPVKSTGRGGNKRVVSEQGGTLVLPYRFDDVRQGIEDAVNRTRSLP